MKKTILLAIIFLAFVVRFYKLGDYPALNADEAAIGYNAYSLLETGRDEHGNPWPIHFQSFNDYKPGLYVYMVLPFVKYLGLTVWSVRIPGALAGVGTVFVLYFLVNELFKKKEYGIFASLLLAISPWHIHFSRGGWEVNVATFLIVLGVYLFVKGCQKVFSIKYLVLSILFFVLALYTYHAARVIVPFLGLGLVITNLASLRSNLKQVVIAGFVGLVLLLPLVNDLTKSEISSRAAGVGLFADSGPLNRINEQRGEHTNFSGIFPKLLHNKAVNYSLAFFANWLDHYNGEFLFLSGDAIQRNKVPETGQMYLFDILFLAIGIVAISKNYSQVPKAYSLVLWWAFVAPVAAALTFQSPHALRAQNMVIPLTLISSVGMAKIVEWLNTFKVTAIKNFGLLTIGILVVWSFGRYQHMYWIHMAKAYPYSSQYGMAELVNFTESQKANYDKIVVTTRYDQPYILFLFYTKYPPAKFQQEHSLTPRDQFGFSTVEKFDKYVFKPINWSEDRLNYPRSLVVGTPDDIPDGTDKLKEIYGTNGFKYFEVAGN